MFGVNNIIGRTLVIHEDEKSTLGSRLACGIIKDSTGFSSEAIQNSDLSVIVGEGIIIHINISQKFREISRNF